VKQETHTILAADCGSATTQVVLIEKQNNIYRLAASAKALSSVAHRDGFRAGHIDRERRRRTVGQQTQGASIGVALPDSIEGTHLQRDRCFGPDLTGNVHQDTSWTGLFRAAALASQSSRQAFALRPIVGTIALFGV